MEEYADTRALSLDELLMAVSAATVKEAPRLAQLVDHWRVTRSPRALSAALTGDRELQAPHLDLIDDAFGAIANHTSERLLLTMPPRHGKSRRVRWAVLWFLINNPHKRVIIASYSATLAESHGRWLRDTIAAHGDLLGIHLKPSSSAAGRWDIDGTEGGVLCVGVGGPGTGSGADVLVVDDPVKNKEEAESERYQERNFDWWQSVATTRLEPDGGAVMIQTRWSPGDLAGRCLSEDPDRWHHIDLPAVAITPDEYEALDLEPVPDPLGRAPGEALWPERYDADRMVVIRRDVGERTWWALYQQQPRPATGTLLSRDDTVNARVTPDQAPKVHLRAGVAVDPSGGGRDTAGVVGGFLGDDRRLYLTDDLTAVMPTEEWARAACKLAHKLDAERIFVETNFGGDQATLIIRTAWEALVREGEVSGFCPQIVAVVAKKNKKLRAEPIAGQWREDKIRIVGALPKLEHEWQTWVADAASPGRIDASVYLAYGMLPVPGSEAVVGSPAKAGGKTTRGGSRYSRPVHKT